MWIKRGKLAVGQEIIGIRDKKSVYYCHGMRVFLIDNDTVVIRHPHGDLEYIEDIETEFRIKEN